MYPILQNDFYKLQQLKASCSETVTEYLYEWWQIVYQSDQQAQYSKPLPWIGIYVALASLFCVLAMVANLLHGLRNRKLWFPCKYFTLNAASLTVIVVAMKLPMDLNNLIPVRSKSYCDSRLGGTDIHVAINTKEILKSKEILESKYQAAHETVLKDQDLQAGRLFSVEKLKRHFPQMQKGAAGRKAGGPKKKPITKSVKAGLQFPVGRIGRNDEELGKLLAGVTIAHGGVLPNINPILLPKKSLENATKEPKSPAKSPKKA
ncbi:hypothetical protein L1887_01114 [Cichorium endivia]|nr:hypothetical protein L1887_01114 [Cichorium endivia]